jgi:hypothetical protein
VAELSGMVSIGDKSLVRTGAVLGPVSASTAKGLQMTKASAQASFLQV